MKNSFQPIGCLFCIIECPLPYRNIFFCSTGPIYLLLVLEPEPLLFCSVNFLLFQSVPWYFAVSLLFDSVYDFFVEVLDRVGLVFVQCDLYGPICIFLHTDYQLDNTHLLKMLSFFPLYGFGFFVKLQVSVGVWGFFLFH